MSIEGKQKAEKTDMCARCGKLVAASALGSLTGWVFQDSRCRCPRESKSSALPEANTRVAPRQVDKSELPYLNDDLEIISLLGRGGMSAVYKVKNTKSNEIFAAKVLRRELVQDESAVIRFRREAESCMKLSHPNLVTVHGDGIASDGSPYLLMDFIEGETLAAVLNNRLFEFEHRQSIEIFLQILDAVEHAHQNGIIHRDLKPGNVLIAHSETDIAKVVDFGIAKSQDSKVRETQNLTESGDIFGSPNYMSPEQCLGVKLDTRSDIYSLGCMLCEMLTGSPPFIGSNPVEIIAKHLNHDQVTIHAPSITQTTRKDLSNIINKCIEQDPASRYQNIAELRDDIKRVLEGRRPQATSWSIRPERRQINLGLIIWVLFTISFGMSFAQVFLLDFWQVVQVISIKLLPIYPLILAVAVWPENKLRTTSDGVGLDQRLIYWRRLALALNYLLFDVGLVMSMLLGLPPNQYPINISLLITWSSLILVALYLTHLVKAKQRSIWVVSASMSLMLLVVANFNLAKLYACWLLIFGILHLLHRCNKVLCQRLAENEAINSLFQFADIDLRQ